MSQLNVLVVDDEPAICALLVTMLADAGHKTMCATNGRQALRMLKEQKFDLVICDILMPDYDGLELLMDMKKEHLSAPVIAMSGGGDTASFPYFKLATGFGAVAVLAKPFTSAKLLAAVATASTRGTLTLDQCPPPPPTETKLFQVRKALWVRENGTRNGKARVHPSRASDIGTKSRAYWRTATPV